MIRRAVSPRWYAGLLPTAKPRIQVTIDHELAQALARIDPAPVSKAALLRDLALRGAQAIEEERAGRKAMTIEEERARMDEALTILREIADGTRDYDFAAAAELHARRGEHLT